jgi:hypothetical protein
MWLNVRSNLQDGEHGVWGDRMRWKMAMPPSSFAVSRYGAS